MKLLHFTSLLLMLIVCTTEAKRYERCEFARYLLNHGFNKTEIATWSCLADHETKYDSKTHNKDTGEFGILQINSKHWCSQKSGGCGIPCQSLLEDDIATSLECAKMVFEDTARYKDSGFDAWYTYKFCKENPNRYIEGCF